MNILIVNAGSSSLKVKVIELPSGKVLYVKHIEHIGEKNSVIQAHSQAFYFLDLNFNAIDAVGHRVVHGGEKFSEGVLINDEVVQTIKKLIPLAPLHNPANLEGIKLMQTIVPHIPQVAIFDTAFHTSLEKKAYLYALPYDLYETHHIRRYGFHGTSHKYLLNEAAKFLEKNIEDINIITLHLGNGESICAIKNGKSIDISMGFTPLEGLIMGSRSGDIDAEIVLYMQKTLGLSIDEVDTILNKKSGLLGICGDNDLRDILNRDDPRAKLAVDMMVRRIQKYIGSYLVLLEGKVDAIVFSGGIGEHADIIRKKILDNDLIGRYESFVIHTDEELEIANESWNVLKDI
ncbi:acetate kinase [Sulfurimonas sp. C5]|uniref:acetate kinase n=1 Tax=Sulfurimonas sp. C5 TaxID=3036947 RepID=UPI002456B41C|nr:acetate kinase [Sulfurimonas sp. C5]MDH4944951.1 acetate kinase [Sulfurimonas sp. C5]